MNKGKHKVQNEGLCGEHAEKVKKLLDWWEKNRTELKKKYPEKSGKNK